MGPARGSPNMGPVFRVDPFDVKVEDRKAICPAGQTSSHCSRLSEEYRIEWNPTVCQACPLRDRCLGPRRTHRTIEVGQYHTPLQARRREIDRKSTRLNSSH